MGATCCKHEQVIEAGVTLHHFRLLRTIGKGALGKVLLVQHKQTKHYFALKAINKTQCIRRKAVNHVIAERFLLEDIHHTLLVKMHYAFQDEEHFFLVLDVMAGGDLRFQLTQTGPLSELQVRFYMAEIALGLASLHQQRIAHRDIKPENILLDAEGHVHLSDLNTATRFDRHHPLQWSMAGSPAYMAPEMIAKKGYSTSVDWWSLGVLAYELLFGKRPFDCGSNEALLESIVHQPLEFPQHAYEMCSKECLDVITKLLDKSPFHRLGCGLDNFEQFKVHHWFDGIDWTALENKQCKPPYQPEPFKFVAHMDNEENSYLDTLSYYPRKHSVDDVEHPVTEEARWRQVMEEQFLPFSSMEIVGRKKCRMENTWSQQMLYEQLNHVKHRTQKYQGLTTTDDQDIVNTHESRRTSRNSY